MRAGCRDSVVAAEGTPAAPVRHRSSWGLNFYPF